MPTKQNHSYHKIKSLEIQDGFLDGLKIEFDDNLNCIIGGRGTGKTTILEFIRFALFPPPAQLRRIEKLINHNLETGRIQLHIETKDGLNYFIENTAADKPQVTNDKGEVVDIRLDNTEIFLAEIYSQGDIEDIANDPLYQLNLIDKFISSDIGDIEIKIKSIKRNLEQNANEIIKLGKEITDCQDELSKLPEVTEKLKGIKIEGISADLEKETQLRKTRKQESDSLNQIKKFYSELQKSLESCRSKLTNEFSSCFSSDVFSGENGKFFSQIKEELEKRNDEIYKKLEEMILVCQRTQNDNATDIKMLDETHIKQEQRYQQILAKFEAQKSKIQEKESLDLKLLRLQAIKQDYTKKEQLLRENQGKRQDLINQLSGLRDERFHKRLQVAIMINEKLGPTIKVEIEPFGNIDDYYYLLMESMKGIGLRYTYIVDKVVRTIPPQNLALIVQRGDVKTLAEQLDLDEERTQRFILQLKGTLELYEIETVELHDKPVIKLNDGGILKDSSSLSTGQKCATILPILLLESENPLLIDQPEDNLDNTFMFETVVKSIRNMKGRRQLIFVTHNPNIPVLGNAEKVFVLQSDGKKATIKAQGTVDEVKEYIETILEGGKEAFEQRQKVYGH